MHLVSREMKLYSFPGSKPRHKSKPWSTVQPPPKVEDDPYLLVLLADQEHVAGREEQAKYLLEAAYEGFDQNTVAGFRFRVAGQ